MVFNIKKKREKRKKDMNSRKINPKVNRNMTKNYSERQDREKKMKTFLFPEKYIAEKHLIIYSIFEQLFCFLFFRFILIVPLSE